MCRQFSSQLPYRSNICAALSVTSGTGRAPAHNQWKTGDNRDNGMLTYYTNGAQLDRALLMPFFSPLHTQAIRDNHCMVCGLTDPVAPYLNLHFGTQICHLFQRSVTSNGGTEVRLEALWESQTTSSWNGWRAVLIFVWITHVHMLGEKWTDRINREFCFSCGLYILLKWP